MRHSTRILSIKAIIGDHKVEIRIDAHASVVVVWKTVSAKMNQTHVRS
jgi:hypothetical protein